MREQNERTGYIFQDKNGKWYARTTFTDRKGKRRNIKKTAKDKADAKVILKSIIRQIEDEGEKYIDGSRMTFNELADHYDEHYLKEAEYVDERKISGLRDVARAKGFLTHFREYFGRQRLRDITYGDIYSYRSERLKTQTKYKRPLRLASMNRELAVLRRMLNIALRQGWISKNPFNAGEPLIIVSGERKRERILTVDEEVRLLAACEHQQRKHLKPLLIALLDTGARKGEMLKLQWSDVCFDTRMITFRALNTKTLKSRSVAMTNRLYSEFIVLWEASDKNLNSRVFGIFDNVRHSFKSACKDADIKHGGLDGMTIHSLRHTAATRLVQGQMPIQMVGRILGHTQVNTTYRYLSANAEIAQQAAAIFDALQTPREKVQETSQMVN
ncbi:MAG: tyrosine-type recombinase/integrase [Pyrinomonadaceae bacterium]